MAFWVFIGTHIVSLALTGILLFEHRRLCSMRRKLFEHLHDTSPVRRWQTSSVLGSLYITTTFLIMIISGFFFFT